MIKKLAVVLGTTLVASACGASLDSTPYSRSAFTTNGPITGVVYRLPATDLILSVTYQLKKCPTLANESLNDLVKVVDVSLETQLVPDRSITGTVVVDQPTGDWFQAIKTAKLSLSKEGMLQSAEFEASDKLRETLVAAVKLATSLAGKVLFVQKFDGVKAQTFTCNEVAKKILLGKEQAEAEVGRAQASRVVAAAQLANAPSKVTKEAYDAIESYLASRQAALQAVVEKTKVVDKFRCRPVEAATGWTCDMDKQSDERPLAVGKWLTFFDGTDIASGGGCKNAFNNLVSVRGNQLCVVGDKNVCSAIGKPLAGEPESYSGIYYRLPASGVANAEVGSVTVAGKSCSLDNTREIVNQFQVDVAHFGRLARVPFKNGPFQDSLTSVKFHPNGAVEEIKYSSTRAIAPDVLGTVNDIRKAPGDAELEKLEREFKALELRNKLLEQRKKNRELEESQ